MKTIITSAFILLFAAHDSFASKKPEVSKTIENAVQYDAGALPLEKEETEFVKVSFTIGDNHKIEIIDVNASNEEIKSHVLAKLSELEIDDVESKNDTLYYNIIFKKL